MHALAEEDHKTIPDGWEEKTIGSLCHIWSGGTPSKSEPSFWQGDIPWVSGKDLKAPTLSDSIDHISPEGLRAACRLAPTGAVFLLVRGMGLAKDLPISVANRPMAFNQDIKALVSRTALSGSFIRSAVYHAKDRLMSRIVPSAHGTMTLNLDDVENISILVPGNHEECDAIASVLDLAQSAILAERRLLDTTAEFKRSAMRELFTHGLHGEAQKETEIGRLPESWDVLPLSEVAAIERGRFLHRPRNEPRFYGGSTPFVQTGDVVRSAGRIRVFSQSLNDDGVAISRVFPAGTILITIAANIGYTGILQFASACPDSLVAITPIAGIDNAFLEYFLQTQQREMDRRAPKGTQKNINIQFLNPWPVPVPTLGEQREIVAILDAIDRKIDLHMRKRAVLEDLFKALLHKLMIGEIRVADLDLSALSSASGARAA